ncbi:MAG: thiamine-phosphate kinase [Acidobacteria bacterium]|nr:thiamine-phosphate kinase [Acidobacteriota bacterium]MBS1866127.1 thiamine-phosphate kinase [Acidobacteriota bacterium]
MRKKTSNPGKGRWSRGESELLRRFKSAARFIERHARDDSGVRLGIGDDAAIWRPRAGFETVLTCDWFLEGTHFLRKTHSPDAVGWKCLARAVSDLAAMGAEPRCFLLSLALPESCCGKWLDEFLHGLRRAAIKLGCVLAGGDTTRQDKILINISVVGEVERSVGALRSGARPGDKIYVSGHLGEAELGWRLLQRDKKAAASNQALLQKHFYPEPRIQLGRWLVKDRIATAMMDLSDGLSSDLARLCEASNAGAQVRESAIPIPGMAFARSFKLQEMRRAALHGGDDYELLFTVRPAHSKKVGRLFRGVPLSEIGEITGERRLTILDSNGRSSLLDPQGWDPFQK